MDDQLKAHYRKIDKRIDEIVDAVISPKLPANCSWSMTYDMKVLAILLVASLDEVNERLGDIHRNMP